MSTKHQPHSLSSTASPAEWTWRALDASRPRRAVEHIGHSEASQVFIDHLEPADAPIGSKRVLARSIPILLIDTQDAYWAFESLLNKLHAYSRTKEESKADLVAKLEGHLQLLTSLESSTMAPVLRMELETLRGVLKPREIPGA